MKAILTKKSARVLAVIMSLLMLTYLIVPALAEIQWPTKIDRFENYNPVYSGSVGVGTAEEDLNLPETVRAIISLEEMELDPETFVQAEPEVDMSDGYTHYDYYYYGYVAPENKEELYESGEKAIYSVYYADQNSDEPKVGEIGYRIYGSINGSQNVWFECDAAGTITGVILDVPVTWEGDFDGDTEGVYIFKGTIDGYMYSTKPEARITVEDADTQHSHDDEETGEEADSEEIHCDCDVAEDEYSSAHDESCPFYKAPECNCDLESDVKGSDHDRTCPLYVQPAEDCHCGPDGQAIDADNFPWAHQEDCIHFAPAECTCREVIERTETYTEEGITKTETYTEYGDYSHEHDPDNKYCMLYGRDTVEVTKTATGEKTVMAADDVEKILEAQNSGSENTVPYPALGEIEVTGSSETGRISDGEMELLAANYDTADLTAADSFMAQNTPTSGAIDTETGYGHVPGTWVDYINTIWQNKAVQGDYEWSYETSTDAYNGWVYSGGVASGTGANPAESALQVPAKVNSIWTVYSGEQFFRALLNAGSDETIELFDNLDMGLKNISSVYRLEEGVKIDGNGKTIYNMLRYTDGNDGSVISFSGGGISDLTFSNCKVIAEANAKFINNGRNPHLGTFSLTNVYIRESMIYATDGHSVPFGNIQGTPGTDPGDKAVKLTNCNVIDCSIRGKDHTLGLAGAVNYAKIKNCSVTETIICSIGNHSAGLVFCVGSCVGHTIENCFVNAEQYGSNYVAAFGGSGAKTIKNCFATGKLEGYRHIIGFSLLFFADTEFKNCYSTVLTGLRSECESVAGFVDTNAEVDDENTPTPHATIATDCYAAGEVGDYNVNMKDPSDQIVGGFISKQNTGGEMQFSNCYYDKQTTAMREWAASDTKSLPGVTGVLTSDYTDADGTTIAGLASGKKGNKGFTGFTNDGEWVYTDQHYPQLAVFANATAADWGSDEMANLVKANSLASTSTVFLSVWNEGYDWDEAGVRTVEEVSYARNPDGNHKGSKLSYDTVRSIISPFTVTEEASFSQLIPGGAPSEPMTDSNSEMVTKTVVVDNDKKTGTVENPGVDWYGISRTVEGQTATRPIRLCGYMRIGAGEDKTIYAGQLYNHRSDVQLNVINTFTENLVIGLDDDKVWSTTKQGGYPPGNDLFYAVDTDYLGSAFSSAQDAWIYTEIWRAAKDENGYVEPTGDDTVYTDSEGNKYKADVSVKVTGEGTGNNETITEQKWNGDYPFPDTDKEQKYIVSYYWMLTDGRYVTDYKIITVKPGEYDLSVDVRTHDKGDKTDELNSVSMYLGTAADKEGKPAYALSKSTTDHSELNNQPGGTPLSAAWKKYDGNVNVVKTQIDFIARDSSGAIEEVMGTAYHDGELKAGDTLKVEGMKYFYLDDVYDEIQKAEREETVQGEVDVTYTVAEGENGELVLRLNNNIEGKFKDIQYDTVITIWVENGSFSFTKTDKEGKSFGEGEATFDLYVCDHAHDASCGGADSCNHKHIALGETGSCWTKVGTASTDENGKVSFANVAAGDYLLVETETKAGYQLPAGQWQITLDEHIRVEDGGIKAVGSSMPPAFKVGNTDGIITYSLPNYPVMTLPASGGMGAMLFTAGGIVLIGAAVTILILTHRKKEK